MLCVYYPTKSVLRNANVDNEERMTLLTSYKSCLLDRFKEDAATAKAKRDELKSRLAKIQYLDRDFPDEESRNKYLEHLVYDLSGYMLHSRKGKIGKCEACWKTILTGIELPSDEFYADKLVVLKSKGGLKKATRNMFSIFLAVEKIYHFKTEDAYIRDSFEKVISKIAKLHLHPVGCCESHREKMVTELIYDYVVIRYRFEAKSKKEKETHRANSQRHKNRKMSKLLTVQQVKNSRKVAQKPKARIVVNSVTKKLVQVAKKTAISCAKKTISCAEKKRSLKKKQTATKKNLPVIEKIQKDVLPVTERQDVVPPVKDKKNPHKNPLVTEDPEAQPKSTGTRKSLRRRTHKSQLNSEYDFNY